MPMNFDSAYDSEAVKEIVRSTLKEIQQFLEFELEGVVHNSNDVVVIMTKTFVYRIILDEIEKSLKSLSGG